MFTAAAAAAVPALAFALVPMGSAPADPVPAYRTAQDARPVSGATSGGQGPMLPGPGTYTDAIAKGERKQYRVRLDGTSNAFLSAVLAPTPGSAVGVIDGITLSLTSPSGLACGQLNDIRFYGGSARPIADYVSRRIEPGRECQQPGEYLLVVEGVGRDQDAATARRPIELKYVVEPGLRAGSTPPPAPTAWSTAAPPPATQPPHRTSGGTGFNDAAPVGDGVWRDTLRPGESRFYRVPVAWGQQLCVDAQFANSAQAESTVTPDGLRVTLYNPARGVVEEHTALYSGRPATIPFVTAPAAYANRTQTGPDAVNAMRFQGSYYLQLTLDRRVPTPVPLALNVSLRGTPQPGPAYAGDTDTSVFGLAGHERDHQDTMRTVGLSGIGLGTALVLALATWTALGRRGRGASKTRALR